MAAVKIEIPEDVLDSARLTPAEAKRELALALYSQQRLSAGKARAFAGLSLWEFRQLSASRGVPVHFDESELADDLKAIDCWEHLHSDPDRRVGRSASGQATRSHHDGRRGCSPAR